MTTPPTLACAIETSSALGSVALVSDDRILVEQSFARGLRHGRDLVPSLDAVVRRAAIDRRAVNLVVVGTGPGSYTGLRVGVASAKALAFALAVPLVGVPSSDAAVYALQPRPGLRAAVIVDAKRDFVYLSLYAAQDARWDLLGEHRILPPQAAADSLPPGTLLLGDGADRFRAIFASRGFEIPADLSGAPSAGCLGILGVRNFRTTLLDQLLTVEPLYLRLSEAEEKRLARPDGHSTT
jgi:tRNA threonylcarbamoyladenosine biosynthesis protein TsaB